MTDKIKRTDKLLAHFVNGGGPLTAREISGMFDIRPEQARKLISQVQSSRRFDCRARFISIDGIKMRELYSMVELNNRKTKRTRREEARRKQIRKYFLEHPTHTIYQVTTVLMCGHRMAEKVREKLVKEGLVPKQTTRQEHPMKKSIIHAEDIPHMSRAVKFREIWPTWKREQ